jgi:putative cardiolipin synthase
MRSAGYRGWRPARLLGAALLLLLAAGCATLPRDVARVPSHAWQQPEASRIGRAFAAALAAHAGRSGLLLLGDGRDAYAARIALVEAAEHTLDLQYYSIGDDDSTRALFARILAAAVRGVRVRVLVDDIHAAGHDVDLAAFSAHPNIEVRVFNPFRRRGSLGAGRLLELLGDPARLNHRMHNKAFVADAVAAVIGGRNLSDAYFGARADFGFVDLDVLAIGPVAAEVDAAFDAYWGSAWAYPIEAFVATPPTRADAQRVAARLAEAAARLRESRFVQELEARPLSAQLRGGRVTLTWAVAQAVYDDPAKVDADAGPTTRLASRLRPLLDGAQRSIVLVSPYFVPGADGVALLRDLGARGVRTRLLTNSLAGTDVVAAHAGYSRYRRALLDAGVEVHELRAAGGSEAGQVRLEAVLGASRAALHAKTIVVDGRYVFVGSMNLDPRSQMLNTECGLLIDSEEVARDLLSRFTPLLDPRFSYALTLADTALRWSDVTAGEARTSTVEPDTTPWRRLQAATLAVVAPEHWL